MWVLKLTVPSNTTSTQFSERKEEMEAPILWLPDVTSRLIGKNLDAGKNWRQEEKGVTEDEVVGWHHQLNAHESEETRGDSDGQGSLGCCSSWSHNGWTTANVTGAVLRALQVLNDWITIIIIPGGKLFSPCYRFKNLRPREDKWFACSHTASKWRAPAGWLQSCTLSCLVQMLRPIAWRLSVNLPVSLKTESHCPSSAMLACSRCSTKPSWAGANW